jgi:hypothetical protein
VSTYRDNAAEPLPVPPPPTEYAGQLPQWPEQATDGEIQFWEALMLVFLRTRTTPLGPKSSEILEREGVAGLADCMMRARRNRFGVR